MLAPSHVPGQLLSLSTRSASWYCSLEPIPQHRKDLPMKRQHCLENTAAQPCARQQVCLQQLLPLPSQVPGPPAWWTYFQELFQLLIFYWAIVADALLLKVTAAGKGFGGA